MADSDRLPARGTAGEGGGPRLDPAAIRADFPILSRTVHGKPLVYLDSAASTHKPRAVLESMDRFCASRYSNVHRGLHRLSALATESFEGARERVRRFLNAARVEEIVFTSGTTGAINLVAHSFGAARVGRDDEVVVTELEHHSNIVPWQMLCERNGARLRVVPIDDAGDLDLARLAGLLGDRTRLVAVAHVSNAIGTANPVAEIVRLAHARGVPVLVDGAQAASHRPVDVQALGCDFYAFSAHKAYGPTGIGVLYGRAELLREMPPFLGGGEMIHSVAFERTTYKAPPQRFEAGTPDIVGAVGLSAALDYAESVGLDAIAAHERELVAYAEQRLSALERVRLVGRPRERTGIVSLVVQEVHPHDVGTALDLEGIAVRAGHHCAQPLMRRLGLPATVRVSFGVYNRREDVDVLCAALPRAIEVLG